MLRRRNMGSWIRGTRSSAARRESAGGLEHCRDRFHSNAIEKRGGEPVQGPPPGKVRASAAAPTAGAAAPAAATAPRFGLLGGGAFLRCVGGSGWLHDYLLLLGSRQVLIASLPWPPRWRE